MVFAGVTGGPAPQQESGARQEGRERRERRDGAEEPAPLFEPARSNTAQAEPEERPAPSHVEPRKAAPDAEELASQLAAPAAAAARAETPAPGPAQAAPGAPQVTATAEAAPAAPSAPGASATVHAALEARASAILSAPESVRLSGAELGGDIDVRIRAAGAGVQLRLEPHNASQADRLAVSLGTIESMLRTRGIQTAAVTLGRERVRQGESGGPQGRDVAELSVRSRGRSGRVERIRYETETGAGGRRGGGR